MQQAYGAKFFVKFVKTDNIAECDAGLKGFIGKTGIATAKQVYS
jgi:hypothetical protein